MRKSPWLVFALVFGWKVALFLIAAQPIPANDAFFYDGAVIHKLLYGGYYNPCVAIAFPISGTQVFSNYPPFYQFVLMGWMAIFGTSVRAAMAFHIVLFGCFLLTMLAILKRLKTPAWCINLSGGFLLALTFHDRPDTLAHVLGILALYAWVRSRRILGGDEPGSSGNNKWVWLIAVFIILDFCTSLQIGAIYWFIVTAGSLAACQFGREKFPMVPVVLMTIVPTILALIVKFALPVAWEGFMQNVHQTPFLTGLRFPQIPEILKIFRSVPGLFLVFLLLPLSWFKQHNDFTGPSARQNELVLLPVFIAALGISLASLCLLAANTVSIASYLQPLLVATYLGICAALFPNRRWLRTQVILLSCGILLASVRAIGMTTWGIACAADVSCSAANQRIETELAGHAPGYTVAMSSAFLYDAINHKDINLIHCDWLAKANGDSRLTDIAGLLKQRPQKLILTQFDYYRRFEAVLKQVATEPALVKVEIINTAHTRAPDSYKSLQQVVQHISWAPVIVNLTWRTE